MNTFDLCAHRNNRVPSAVCRMPREWHRQIKFLWFRWWYPHEFDSGKRLCRQPYADTHADSHYI